MLGLLDQPKECAVGVDHLTAFDQGEPMVKPLVERPLFAKRLLVGPVDDRLRRRRVRHLVAA